MMYRKDVKAGEKVVLGSNGQTYQCVNYIVMAVSNEMQAEPETEAVTEPVTEEITEPARLRHNEYYSMQETFDKLYADSKQGKVSP